jgi:hypothetical protein
LTLTVGSGGQWSRDSDAERLDSGPRRGEEGRLAADLTDGRRDDLRDAAASIAVGEGAGGEDLVVANDRPVEAVAQQVMAWPGLL